MGLNLLNRKLNEKYGKMPMSIEKKDSIAIPALIYFPVSTTLSVFIFLGEPKNITEKALAKHARAKAPVMESAKTEKTVKRLSEERALKEQ